MRPLRPSPSATRTDAASKASSTPAATAALPVAGAAGAGARSPPGRLAHGRDDAPAVVGRVELETGDLERYGAAAPGEHLQRERRAGHVLLDHHVVAAALQLAPRRGQPGLVVHHGDALAAARGAGLDHRGEPALRPVQRARHVQLGEQPPRGQLGRGDAVGVEVEQQRHTPGRHPLGQPGQRRLVLERRQHGVAARHEIAEEALVGGHVHDDVAIREAGARGAPRAGPRAPSPSRPCRRGTRPRCPAACRRRSGGARAHRAPERRPAPRRAAMRARYSSTPAGRRPRRSRCGSTPCTVR